MVQFTLVLALSVSSDTSAMGATKDNALVDIVEFYNIHIAPELRAPDVLVNVTLR